MSDQIAHQNPDEQSPDAILAAFEGSSAHASEESKPRDAALDGADTIRAQVVAPDHSIKSGLVHGALPELPETRRTPEEQAELDRLFALHDEREEVEEDHVKAGASAIAALSAQAVLEAAEYDSEEAAQMLANVITAGDIDDEGAVEELAFDAALTAAGLEADDLETLEDEELDLLDAEAANLLASAKFIAAIGVRDAKAAEVAELAPKLVEAAAKDTAVTLREWAAAKGYQSDAEATAALQRVEAAVREDTGMEMEEVALRDQDAFKALLYAQSGADDGVRKAYAEKAFQQSVLDTETTDISSGLEVLGPLGWQKVNDPQVGPPTQERVNRLTEKSIPQFRETTESIRQGVAATESTSVADGLTSHGRPISADEATGERERVRAEQERARADALARIGGRLR